MKAILLMFDSLNRHMLSPYGGDWIHAPNFSRLAERTVTFDNAWVGSMPCMPARRDLHTGRLGFLHRSWGPLEPFDDSMPRLLKENGVHSHLVSDHYHYWETGGATYHTQYSTWNFSRGQEGDPWRGSVATPDLPDESRWLGRKVTHDKRGKLVLQDIVNRNSIIDEDQFPQARTFADGIEFIEENSKEDRWFLQIETFDPHEPFFSPERYKALYSYDPSFRHFDWPDYKKVTETPEEVEHCRYEYAALVSMCDTYLGKVLDTMDRLKLWEDTMLIVTTDHGFLLGEHGWWAKYMMPLYSEISRIPMFCWDPRNKQQGTRCYELTQLTDIGPTMLELFGIDIPKRMLGRPFNEAFIEGREAREAVLFGYHGGQVNCTDGRYVYMRAPVDPDNAPLYEYTLMPTHMAEMFTVDELLKLKLAEPFNFTQGVQTLKIPTRPSGTNHTFETMLFDLSIDPGMQTPINDSDIESRMINIMKELMKQYDAPTEQYERLGI